MPVKKRIKNFRKNLKKFENVIHLTQKVSYYFKNCIMSVTINI